MGDLCRNPAFGNILVGDAEGDSVGFPMQTFAGAIVHVPAGESTTALTVYVADSDDDSPTYNPLFDATGAQVVVAVTAGNAYELPAAIFAAPRIKLVADSITGAEPVSFPITLKS